MKKGFTLLELSLVVLASSLMMGVYLYMINDNLKGINNKNVANHLMFIANATENYVKVNRNKLLQYTSNGATFYIPTAKQSDTGAVPTSGNSQLPGLQEGGFLPGNFIDVDRYQFKTGVIFTQPSIGIIDALVVTQNGQPINSVDAGEIVHYLGMKGGFLLGNSNQQNVALNGDQKNTIYGLGGSWAYDVNKLQNANVTIQTNHPMVLVNSYSDPYAANSLNRYETGMYGTNTLYKDLNVTGYNIKNALAYQTQNINTNGSDAIRVNQDTDVSGNISIGHDEKGNVFALQDYDSSNPNAEAFPELDATNGFQTGNVRGIRLYDAYSNGTIGAGTNGDITADMVGTNTSSNPSGSVRASTLMSAATVRPTSVVESGTPCQNQPIQELTLNPNGSDVQTTNSTNNVVQIGDIARAKDGSLLSCQVLKNGAVEWSSVENPFQTFQGCAGGNYYTNTTNAVQYITGYTNYAQQEDSGAANFYISPNGPYPPTYQYGYWHRVRVKTFWGHKWKWRYSIATGYNDKAYLISSQAITDSSVRFKLLFIHWTSHYSIGNRYAASYMLPPGYTFYTDGNNSSKSIVNSSTQSLEQYCVWK
jgi:competence protein ComGC